MNNLDIVNTMLKERSVDFRKQKDGENFVELPQFRAGDTVNVALRVVEGEKERIQNFKGIVLSVRGGGLNKSFVIRKVSNGIGVERVFMIFSPMIQSIEVLKKGHVRRSKLYYLRGMSEKKIRQKLK